MGTRRDDAAYRGDDAREEEARSALDRREPDPAERARNIKERGGARGPCERGGEGEGGRRRRIGGGGRGGRREVNESSSCRSAAAARPRVPPALAQISMMSTPDDAVIDTLPHEEHLSLSLCYYLSRQTREETRFRCRSGSRALAFINSLALGQGTIDAYKSVAPPFSVSLSDCPVSQTARWQSALCGTTIFSPLPGNSTCHSSSLR